MTERYGRRGQRQPLPHARLTAKQFYDQFSDRPVTVELANERKERMLSLAQEAVGALDASADGKYGVLNRIAMAGFGAAD